MIKKTAITILVFSAMVIAAADAMPPRPLLTIRKLPPGVKAAKVIWAQPPTVARFYFSKLSQPAGQRAEVRLAYDNVNLYAAFRCLDSGKGKKGYTSPEGELVPDNDSASFLLDIDNDGRTYCMFTTTSAGGKSAELGRQVVRDTWNVDWAVETSKKGDSWTAFMTIPFKSLGVSTPKAGTRWGAQLSRFDPAVKWPIFWARVRKDPREVQRSGEVMFAGAGDISAALSDIQVDVPGQQNTSLYVSNPTKKPAQLKVEFVANGKTADVKEISAGPGESVTPIKFNYPFDDWKEMTVTVTDKSGKIVYQSPGIPVRMASYASRVAQYSQIAKALLPPSASVASELARLNTQLRDLTKSVEAAKGDKAKWEAHRNQVNESENAVGRLRSLCADTNGIGYAVGTETALRKIMRYKLFEGDFGQPAKIELARNEFDSTQIAVIANDSDLKDVLVSVSDLTGDGGAVIPASAAALNLVEFVETGQPPYEIEYIGWYPDPLMDFKSFDLAKGAIRPVWITVRTPENAKAGLYKGTITVKPANAEQTQIPFEVTVWDFALPTTPHLKTAFTFDESQYRGWYGEPMSKSQRHQAYQMLLEHRLNPSNIYSKKPQPDMEDIPFCVERGMNAMNLCFMGGAKSNTVRAEMADMISKYEQYLKQNKWENIAYIYGFDEPWSGRFPDLRNQFGWSKEQFPNIPRMCTVLPNKELKGYVDIWVPLVANFDYEESQQYIKDGDEVWWYICCGPEKPFPNWFVDYSAIDPRILFWMNWKYQVPGFLYWTIDRWQTNLKEREPKIQKLVDAGKRWPEIPWNTQTTASFNGDGHLVYPGPDGKLLSSVRLEAVRDGIDDYEYFYILNELVKQAESKPNFDKALIAKAKGLLKVNENAVKSRTEFTHDPKVLLGARREVAEMIEKVAARIR